METRRRVMQRFSNMLLKGTVLYDCMAFIRFTQRKVKGLDIGSTLMQMQKGVVALYKKA